MSMRELPLLSAVGSRAASILEVDRASGVLFDTMASAIEKVFQSFRYDPVAVEEVI
jgi:hypothetical protein